MIRSMTGWGEAERDTPLGRLRLEVKTVNHRFFNVSIKAPAGFDRFEKDIRNALRAHLSRGHVSAYLSLDRGVAGTDAGPRVDLEKARAYRDALEVVRRELGIEGAVDLGMLARFGDIFRPPEADIGGDEVVGSDTVQAIVAEAARSVLEHREAEGLRLKSDLEARLFTIVHELDRVEARAPERLVAERDRLRERVRELADQAEVDEERLAREIAYVADKWDLHEEIVRFRSHIELFREALEGDGSEAVGKRLGFLVQEMHREANTIGSKANDVAIGQAAMAIKEEIERLREQLENVE